MFDESLQRYLRSTDADRGANYFRAIDLGTNVVTGLRKSGFNGQFEIVQSHDLHIFLNLSPRSNQTLHIQVYPGMSTDHGVVLTARVLDTARMNEIRAQEAVSKGNEHEAAIKLLIPQTVGAPLPWDDRVITERLVAALSKS